MSAYARKYAHIVKDLLLRRADLTHATLIEMGGGWRLAAVIYYLKTRESWPIDKYTLPGSRVAHYFLPRGWKPEDAEVGAAALGEGDVP